MDKYSTIEQIINTAHIHLDNATFRIHVQDADVFPIRVMNEDDSKPEFILWISKSNDPEQKKQSLLVSVGPYYSLDELNEWVQHYGN